MKVWLNDLKEGDIFYYPSIVLNTVLKCEHLGDAHNMNYRMSRIKYKILEGADDNTKDILDILGDSNESFVNQYVYNDYDSAKKELIEKLNDKLKTIKTSIKHHKICIDELLDKEKQIKEILNETNI